MISANIPILGAYVEVLRESTTRGDVYQPATVVGHLHDPDIGTVLELRLSNSRRMHRVWPTSTIRLAHR